MTKRLRVQDGASHVNSRNVNTSRISPFVSERLQCLCNWSAQIPLQDMSLVFSHSLSDIFSDSSFLYVWKNLRYSTLEPNSLRNVRTAHVTTIPMKIQRFGWDPIEQEELHLAAWAAPWVFTSRLFNGEVVDMMTTLVIIILL